MIKPAVEQYGYDPIRADHIAEPGIITSQIIEHVVESPLVIADLTGSNANVFYELAVRHAHQKPLIQLISKDDEIPFDVAGTRIIQIDLSDIESVENTKTEIKDQIESIENNNSGIENPISVALDLKHLRESADPEERSMADIMETLSELRTNMVSIQKSLDNPEELIPPSYFRELKKNIEDGKYDQLSMRIKELDSMTMELREIVEEEEIDNKNIFIQIDDVRRQVARMRRDLESSNKFVVKSKSLGDFGDFEPR
ncbi:hypothetical protein B2G88_16325 [Natronolimnobius baerhuensis]|uniref:Uncharacterized protein n=1 Tax=Natronolimnobius baerhuensis TaxID=253108 RepID=A0A202E7P7_9EURY|nr:hypothetical protein B2G88_16325 [Natronolimnobius baerhuensis]